MSSNPGYARAPRPQLFTGYHICPVCSFQYYPEQPGQAMCRLCFVHQSYRMVKPEYTATCHKCKQAFTTTVANSTVKYCSDVCRKDAHTIQKAERRARLKGARA